MNNATSNDSAVKLMVRKGRSYIEASNDQILEAARVVISEKYPVRSKIANPDDSANYFKMKLAGMEREVFAALFLDSRHQILGYRELFYGTIDGAEVHPREVVKAALELNCASIVLGHNHPSGNPDPSAADRAVAQILRDALKLIDVRLLDHIVVAGNSSVSLAARGWV